jgi:hypothetical protein
VNHHHTTSRVIVAATAIAIAFTACGDDTTSPTPAVGVDQPANVALPAPDLHPNETQRFERLQPTVEYGRSQRLVQASIESALADRHTRPVVVPAFSPMQRPR